MSQNTQVCSLNQNMCNGEQREILPGVRMFCDLKLLLILFFVVVLLFKLKKMFYISKDETSLSFICYFYNI